MADGVKEFTAIVKGKADFEIVACTYLNGDGGKMAFVDRLNSELLIADRQSDIITRIPLRTDVVGPAKPSDINHGTSEGRLLVTFTDNDPGNGSKVIQYRLQESALQEEWSIVFKDRTRSVALLDPNNLVATFQWKVRVFDRHGREVASRDRSKRDKGGMVSVGPSDGSFFYGDGNEFVGCRFDANRRMVSEIFRYSANDVKFPRGSAILENGDLLVCCDESRRVIHVSRDGRRHHVLVTGTDFGFGDIDYHGGRREFVVTRWPMKAQQGKMPPMAYSLARRFGDA